MKKNMVGKNNPNYKHGKSKCQKCGKILRHYKTKLCIECYGKSHTGKDSPNYKDGKNKCIDCGKLLSDYNAERCWDCYIKWEKSKNNPDFKSKPNCQNCEKPLRNYGTKLCKKCWVESIKGKKRPDLSGEKNPNFKGGWKKKNKRYCVDCGKPLNELAKYCKTKRCWDCYVKWNTGKNNPMYGIRGEKNPNYKKGKPKCKGCGTQLKSYGSELCYGCYAIEQSKNNTGKNNSNYVDGKSREPYPLEFNNALKESIRNRHNRICQLCGVPEIECNQALDVHHIDSNKKNNDPKNLIPLCNRCHSKTKKNRKHWETYFKELLEKQGVLV